MSQNERKLDYLSEYCKKFQFLHCFHGVSFLEGDVQKGELRGEGARGQSQNTPTHPTATALLRGSGVFKGRSGERKQKGK